MQSAIAGLPNKSRRDKMGKTLAEKILSSHSGGMYRRRDYDRQSRSLPAAGWHRASDYPPGGEVGGNETGQSSNVRFSFWITPRPRRARSFPTITCSSGNLPPKWVRISSMSAEESAMWSLMKNLSIPARS